MAAAVRSRDETGVRRGPGQAFSEVRSRRGWGRSKLIWLQVRRNMAECGIDGNPVEEDRRALKAAIHRLDPATGGMRV